LSFTQLLVRNGHPQQQPVPHSQQLALQAQSVSTVLDIRAISLEHGQESKFMKGINTLQRQICEYAEIYDDTQM
jgi:hypothetical protein